MPDHDPARCGACGGPITRGTLAAAIPACEFCGAQLSVPAGSEACDVRLDAVGASKIPVVKVIASYSSLGVGRDLVESAPSIVREGVSIEEAEALRDRLVAAGAKATIMRGDIELAPAQDSKVPQSATIGGGPWTGGTPIEIARVEDGELLASGKVGASSFEIAVPTQGAPVNVQLRACFAPPMTTALLHFNHPLRAPRNLGGEPFLPKELFGSFARLSDTTMDPSCGMLSLAAEDANGKELAGVRFTAPPGLELLYVDERGGYTPGRQETSEHGFAYLLNVPPGIIEVGALGEGAPWPAGRARIEADTVSALIMRRAPF